MSQQEIQVPAEQTIATTAPTMADTTGGESEAEADSQSESRTPTRDMDTSLPADTEAESRQGTSLNIGFTILVFIKGERTRSICQKKN